MWFKHLRTYLKRGHVDGAIVDYLLMMVFMIVALICILVFFGPLKR